jgi:hypothetical protein
MSIPGRMIQSNKPDDCQLAFKAEIKTPYDGRWVELEDSAHFSVTLDKDSLSIDITGD